MDGVEGRSTIDLNFVEVAQVASLGLQLDRVAVRVRHECLPRRADTSARQLLPPAPCDIGSGAVVATGLVVRSVADGVVRGSVEPARLEETDVMECSGWFGVRCVFRAGADGDEGVYEERVTVWRACDAAGAIRLAEADARDYARDVEGSYLGLAQVYTMADDLVAGAEVFSLLRTSTLSPGEYLGRYFDTGTENQTRDGARPGQ